MEKYSIGFYSVEVKKSDLMRALHGKSLNDYTAILVDFLMQDIEPNINWSFDSKEEAEMSMNQSGDIEYYDWKPVFVHINGVLVERYEEDEDGEYAWGGSYDYADDLFELEKLEELKAKLFN